MKHPNNCLIRFFFTFFKIYLFGFSDTDSQFLNLFLKIFNHRFLPWILVLNFKLIQGL